MSDINDQLLLLSTRMNKFLFDNFISPNTLEQVVSGSGEINTRLFELSLKTGYTENSFAKAYYKNRIFNPKFGSAFIRFYLDNISDVFAYIGFMKTLSVPVFTMDESHAGIFIKDGVIYFSTGNEQGVTAGHQNVALSGIDVTKDFIFNIKYDSLFTNPCPQRVPYFGTYTITTVNRIWTLKSKNTSFPPDDDLHYFVIYLKNTINMNKNLFVKAFTYGEEYVD